LAKCLNQFAEPIGFQFRRGAEGKARQSIEIQNATLRDAFERMSDKELEVYAREAKLPELFPSTSEANSELVQ
jgi:hypothetical protein